MKKRTKGIISALAITVLLVGCAVGVFASSMQKNILAEYSNIKIYIDGVLITPKDVTGKVVEPFIVDGTTYLPVRAISEALGKNVEWDGSTSSVYVGSQSSKEQYLGQDLKAYQEASIEEYDGTSSFSMSGVKYFRGLRPNIAIYASGCFALYNLSGQYSTLSGMIGHVDGSAMQAGTVLIYGDGQLIQSYNLKPEDITKPFSLSVNGITQLKIAFDTLNYGLGDVVLK